MDSDLNEVLARYPAVARPSAEPEPLGNAGGLSGSRLWRYRSGLGTLVARAWPPDGPPRAALEEVHGWLGEAGPVGFVPVPIRGLDGRTVHERGGRLWELAPWMDGSSEPGQPPPAARVRAAFAALAAFHQRLAHHRSTGPSPGLVVRLREVDWLLGGGFSQIEATLTARQADRWSALARRWVEAARGAAHGVRDALARGVAVAIERQPCLRDVRPDHVLFTGDRVTGLVDFGAMGLDTVAGDLARLASEWFVADPSLRASGLDAYASVRPIGPAETALIDVFERSAALLGPGHWVRWHFVEARTFDDPEAVGRGLLKGIERLTGSG